MQIVISSNLSSTILRKSLVSIQNCTVVPRDCLIFPSLKSISFLKIMESMRCGGIWICGVSHRWRGIDYYSVFTCMVPAKGEMAAVCFFFTSAHHDELWQMTSEQPVKESACNEQPACLRGIISQIKLFSSCLFFSLFRSLTHSFTHTLHFLVRCQRLMLGMLILGSFICLFVNRCVCIAPRLKCMPSLSMKVS